MAIKKAPESKRTKAKASVAKPKQIDPMSDVSLEPPIQIGGEWPSSPEIGSSPSVLAIRSMSRIARIVKLSTETKQ